MSTDNPIREDIVLALGSDYDIIRELGRGGASVVYLGRDRVLGREVAIKVIRDSQTGDAEAVARFEREARTLAALQHPNIVMLYGARPLPGGSLALVMQHGEWTTLKSRIREHGPLPIDGVEQVLRDVASALVYLHRHHVIHRDIKPENIFIEAETGRALISDFGIAKSGDARTSVTLTGVVIGTPAYMSPEQIDGGELTGLSDLYSLGMVGYEMLTGVRPWDGESLFSVIYKQKTERLPSLLQRRPDAPEHLRLLIERATEKSPASRYQGAAELLAALDGPAPAAAVARPWAEPLPAATPAAAPLGDYPTLEIEQALVNQAFAEGARAQKRRQRLMAAAVIVLLFSGGAGALAFSGREGVQDGATDGAAPISAPTDYLSAQQDVPPLGAVAADTPSYQLEEPIVDASPAAAPPQRQTERTPRVTTRVPETQAEADPEVAVDAASATAAQDADTTASIPAAVLPTLSVTRGAIPARRPPGAPAMEARTSQPEAAPAAAPRLRNRERIGQLLAERYPRDLLTRGVGGTTVLTVLVAPDGSVERSSVVSSSGSARLDAAAGEVAARMVFEHPAGAARQAVWVAVPLTFNPR